MPAVAVQPARQLPWSDERLLSECGKGNQEAWAALVAKYKNLVYSIPIKMGLHAEASDIFQSVFVDLLADLQQIREPRAIAKWLIQVCYHKCLRCRAQGERQIPLDSEQLELRAVCGTPTLEELLVQGEREQLVRDAMRMLSARCARLVHMLFYEIPVRPYREIAREFGIASASIGFIRGRCLRHLRAQLERLGFK